MTPIFDLHCHPCLKIYLCNKNISHKHHPLPDLLPSGMHFDLPGMKEANVQVGFCYHYVPEAGLGNLDKSQWIFNLLTKLRLSIIDKFEPENSPDGAYYRALRSMFLLNDQIAKAAGQFDVIVAKNLEEFTKAFEANKIIFIHCLEGGHHLGNNLPSHEHYIARLKHLKSLGVAVLTISHFFPNAVADSGGGIPPTTARLIGYKKPAVSSPGLTETGRHIVEWCQDNNLIIDLVHSTVETREEIYAILDRRLSGGKKTVPIIFSHSGIREIAGDNMPVCEDKLILPTLEELRTIRKHGGLLGLILMNYWIIGREEDNLFKREAGIKYLIDTIREIKDSLGDFTNIAIGTDLDGFTQVPDDVTHVRKMDRLRQAIVVEFGIEAAEQICHKNALRMLTAGWS